MDNLIQFDSPDPRRVQVRQNLLTPGTNSFYELENVANALPKTPKSTLKSIFDTSFANSFEFPQSSNQFGQDSLGFERESLGILDFDTMDLGRQSLALLRPLNKTIIKESLDFSRESLGIINLDHVNLDHESMELSNLRVSSVPEIVLSESKNVSLSDQLLNVAFLGASNTTSNTSACSSIMPSFNSASLQSSEPSKIYSITSVCEHGCSGLNASFINSEEFLKLLQVITPKDHKNSRQRIRSAPEPVIDQKSPNFIEVTEELKFWSDEKPKKKVEETLDYSFLELPASGCEKDFSDFVSIEANHFALRLANGSFLDESFTDVLDRTPQPEELLNVLEDDAPTAKCDTETIFKVVDKMLPPPAHQKSTLEPKIIDPPRVAATLSVNKKESFEKKCVSQTKEAIQIIHNITELLTNENPSDQDKCDGRNLLSSLSHIFEDRIKPNLDDSGHSSIEPDLEADPEKHECFEILDLRTSKTESDVNNEIYDNCGALDLSMKSNSSEKEFAFPEKVSKKIDNASKSSISSFNSTKSLTVLSQNESQLKISLSNRIKPKKGEVKGPMKAVIPMNNMAKKSVYNEKSLIAPKKNAILRKTSTPIGGSKLRPVAHSTPDSLTNNVRNGPWKHPPISPLARPNKVSNAKNICEKLNYSRLSNSSNSSATVSNNRRSLNESNRLQETVKNQNVSGNRRSLTSLPRPQLVSKGGSRVVEVKELQTTRRSSSVEKESIKKIEEKIPKMSYSRNGSLEKINIRDGVKSGLGENRSRPSTTRTSLPRKIGKENAGC